MTSLRNPPVMTGLRAVAVVAVLCCASVVAVPLDQSSPVGSAAISGTVTDDKGRPIHGALVRLVTMADGTGAVPDSRSRHMTDGSGRYVFQRLTAGAYRITVEAPGYLVGGYGRVPGSESAGKLMLQNHQWVGDADIVLQRSASIAGTIRDERGEALVGVPVRILRAFTLAGSVRWASGASTHTDDRGAYRFAGLLPGRYAIQVPGIQVTLPDGEVALYRARNAPAPLPAIRSPDGVGTVAGFFAVPPAGLGEVYPPTFFPAARSLSTADAIAVDFGSQRTAVDVSLVPVSCVSVSGAVVGPPAAIANLPVRLLAEGNESLGFGAETALTITDLAGRFSLAQVPQGDYTLVVGRALNEFQVRQTAVGPRMAPELGRMFLSSISGAPVAGEPDLFLSSTGMSGDDLTGRVSISVGNRAIDGVSVATTAGVIVSGRALYDGVDAPADGRSGGPFGPSVRLDPADGDTTLTGKTSMSGFVARTAGGGGSRPRPADQRFSITNVMPGRYRLLDLDNRDYRLVGATWNGQDLFETPLEVTGDGPVTGIVIHLSSKRNSVSGLVRASDGPELSAGAVFIFPQDRNRWREPGISAPLFRILDVSVDGAFSAPDLIPGDYFVAAVPVEERRRGLDLEFLLGLVPQATRITIDEPEMLTVDLRVIRGGR